MARIGTLRPRLGSIDRRTALPPPKVADAHYSSAAHQAWAAAVIQRAGGQCQGKECTSRPGVRLVADHIVERRDGGADLDLANGQALCWSCHTKKTNEARAKRLAAP